MARRPLVNSHIPRTLKIKANIEYETRCSKKGHCPQYLTANFTQTAAKPLILSFFLMADPKRHLAHKCCQTYNS